MVAVPQEHSKAANAARIKERRFFIFAIRFNITKIIIIMIRILSGAHLTAGLFQVDYPRNENMSNLICGIK